MIEKIRLDSPDEEYKIYPGDNEVIVIMCLENQIKLYEMWSDRINAILDQYETYTTSITQLRIKTDNQAGATFLIVHYYRA